MNTVVTVAFLVLLVAGVVFLAVLALLTAVLIVEYAAEGLSRLNQRRYDRKQIDALLQQRGIEPPKGA